MTKRYRTRSAIVADLFAHPAYEELPRGTEFVLAKDYDALATELMLWKKGCYQPPVPSAREWVDLREAQKTAKEALDREHKTLERVRELEDKLRHSEVERSGLTEQVNRLCLSEQSMIRTTEGLNQRVIDLLGQNDYLQKHILDQKATLTEMTKPIYSRRVLQSRIDELQRELTQVNSSRDYWQKSFLDLQADVSAFKRLLK